MDVQQVRRQEPRHHVYTCITGMMNMGGNMAKPTSSRRSQYATRMIHVTRIHQMCGRSNALTMPRLVTWMSIDMHLELSTAWGQGHA